MAANLSDRVAAILGGLSDGEPLPAATGRRQPVHTVYGGAHLFSAGTTRKLGALALAALDRHASEPGSFAAALDLPGDPVQHALVEARTRHKLATDPVEDYRIDFEDGFGPRPDEEEDTHATRSAAELARAWAEGTAPAQVGIRIKPLTESLKGRSARTLALFLTELAARGAVRPGLVVTLPKVTRVAEVEALVALLALFEADLGLPDRALQLELMVEAPQALLDRQGGNPLPSLIGAADGRCLALHLGAYDLTASVGVTAPDQTLDHPLCDHTRLWMALACAGTAVVAVDGATNVLPIGDRATVHAAWRQHAAHIRRALTQGLHQGWDLHPAQLPVRYAATYGHFLQAAAPMAARLRHFVDEAARAARVGAVFDDAATGLGLLAFFRRGLACGALSQEDLPATGLTAEDLARGDFATLLANRAEAP